APYAVTATVTDKDGGSGSGGTTAGVRNVAPARPALGLSAPAVNENDRTTLTRGFTRPRTPHKHHTRDHRAGRSAYTTPARRPYPPQPRPPPPAPGPGTTPPAPRRAATPSPSPSPTRTPPAPAPAPPSRSRTSRPRWPRWPGRVRACAGRHWPSPPRSPT